MNAANFEIKPALIMILQIFIQLRGHPNKDPYAHITNFLEISDILKMNAIEDNAIWFKFFPFSLKDKSKVWLNSLPSSSITL